MEFFIASFIDLRQEAKATLLRSICKLGSHANNAAFHQMLHASVQTSQLAQVRIEIDRCFVGRGPANFAWRFLFISISGM
jgi:hypothetical protein